MNSFDLSFGAVSIDRHGVETLGWTLIHFLWQGAIVAAGLAVLDALLARSRPQLRYLSGCAALLVMLALPIATFVASSGRSKQLHGRLPSANGVTRAALMTPAPPLDDEALAAPHAPRRSAASIRRGSSLARGWSLSRWRDRVPMSAVLPWMVAFWAIGVGLLSLRLLGGWWLVRRLGRSVHNVSIDAWQETVRDLARRMGVSRPVRLVRSGLVSVPTAIGWLRPVILVPASTLTGLHPAQIEAVLAHELAHIRRHDYLVNLLQSLIEVLLFYHPAVWWVSRRIREERELCCDDLAVRASGDPVSYANALCELERLRGEGVSMALAATGGSLLARIARLVGAGRRPALDPSRALGWAMIALLVLIGGAARSAVRVTDPPALARVARLPAAAVAPLARVVVPAVIEATRPLLPHVAEHAEETAASAGEVVQRATEIAEPTALMAMASTAERTALAAAAMVPEMVSAATRAAEVACQEPKTPSPDPSDDEDASDAAVAPVPAVPAVPGTPATPATPPAGSLRSIKSSFSAEDWQRLEQSGVSPQYVYNLARGGYVDLTVDQLVKLAQHGVSSAYATAMRRTLGDPGVEDLVRLADHGVSTRYVIAMHRELGSLSTEDLVSLADHGVSTQYVAGMRELDLDELGAQDLIRLANSGVTLQWFSALRWMGYSDLTVDRAIQLANAGVTPDYAASLRILNRRKISLDDLLTLRNQGVDVEYAAAMLGMVRKDLSVEQLIQFRNQGVSVNLVATLNALGYSHIAPDELVSLVQQGVHPEFIAGMAAAGYGRLPVSDLVRLTQNGVSAGFVEEVREAGLGRPDVSELIRLRQQGIPKP